MTEPAPAVVPSETPLSAFARRLAAGIEAGMDSDRFGALALELYSLQFEANAAYRRLRPGAAGGTGTVTDWRGIPAVPTAAFKELEMTALPPERRTAVFHSSGTTGQSPSRHFHGPESLALYRTSLLAGFAPLGSPVAGHRPRYLALTPPPAAVPHSSLVHMFGALAERYGAADSRFAGRVQPADGTWELEPDALEETLAEAERSARPLFVLGTAFNFVHLTELCDRRGRTFRLPPESRVLETGGYKGRSRELTRAELHAAIGRCLGVSRERIVREYGMSELGSQAYDLPDGPGSAGVFRFPPWARAVVISPETGREVADGGTGLVRVFDLANVWSVLAIQTEDLAERHGTGFELLGRAARSEPRGCSLMAPP